MGNKSANHDRRTAMDGRTHASDASLEPSLRRLLSDRSRKLIRETCRDLAVARKISACGTRLRDSQTDVGIVRHPRGYAYTTGVQTCGSVWSCPACSIKIRMKRAAEIAKAIAAQSAAGGSVLLLTLTTQHGYGESLDEVWSSVQDAWAYITSHSQYRKLRDDLGMGFVRTVEVMHGRSGWHPHLHVLLFVDGVVDPFDTPDTYRRIAKVFHDLWVRRMEDTHLRCVSSSHGVDLRPVKADGARGVGQYCTKAGYEVALADGKEGRTSSSRHPFAIAHDAVVTGSMADIKLYREWLQTTHGRKMWTWSTKIRKRLQLGTDKSDEELAGEADEVIETICTISPTIWRAIIAGRVGLRSRFLARLDQGSSGLRSAIDLLHDYNVLVVVSNKSSGVPRLEAVPVEPNQI